MAHIRASHLSPDRSHGTRAVVEKTSRPVMPFALLSKGRAPSLQRQQLFVSLLIALLLSVVTNSGAQAALSTTTAAINGGTSYTAFPGEQLAISMSVGYTSGTDWRSTDFRFATSGGYTCEDLANDGHPQFGNSGSGTNTTLLYIPAPTTTGTYTLQLRPREDDDCTDLQGTVSNNLTITVGSYPTTASNPNLGQFCGLDVILVLDESGSIYDTSGAIADVREAAVEFLTGLNNTGSRVAIVEFNTLARQVFNYTVVNDTNLTSLLNYVNDVGTPPQGGYDPPSGAYTNWDDAFQKVEDLYREENAPLVVFITDGDPTTHGDGNVRNTSTTFTTNDVRMTHPIASANRLKAQGAHILAVGVGASLNNAGSLGRLQQISGNDVYPATPLNMSTTDVLRVTNFGDLDTAMRNVVTALCQSSVSVTKRVDPGTGVYAVASGWQFTARVRYPQPSNTNFTWLTPSGSAPTADVTSATDANGVANFQWRPSTTNGLSTIVLTEAQQTGYTLDSFTCTQTSGSTTPIYSLSGTAMTISNISIDAVITCEAKNRLLPATLIVRKVVVNDNGGTKVASDFSFKVNNGTAVAFEADGQNNLSVAAGTYNVTEPAVAGYTTTYSSSCSNTNIANGGTATCTITNNDNAPSLTLVKQVTNDNGGTATPSQWNLTATGPTGFTGAGPTVNNGASFDAGTYTLSESTGPAGYTAGSWSCSGGTQNGSQITLALGQSATCTIINNDQPGTLIVRKVVTNDNGGTKTASDFSFRVNNATAVPFEADGQNNLTVNAGTYTVTEPAVTGYTASYANCANVAVTNGGTTTCTITNNDQPGTLIVRKVVINDNGGTRTANNFSFRVNGGTATSFEADGQNDLTVNAGNYTVVEPAVTGYTTSYSNCDNVAVTNGGTTTCTVTNNDNAPSLTLVKVVVNDNGGNALPSSWTLSAAGPTGFSGVGPTVNNGASFDAGTYALSESTGPAGYTGGNWSCTGSGTQNGTNITLALGQSATCTITNNDDVPGLTLLKKATPLTYSSVGTVITYTYTLTNSGQATLSQPFRVVDDKATVTCPAVPTTLTTGQKITCTATYIITQADLNNGAVTNIATGQAKGPFNNDVFSNQDQETVTAIRLPNILLTKTALQPNFDAPGDVISYTLVATNTGNVSLSNVRITDPKITVLSCTPAQPTTLVPGAKITCSGSYTATQLDVDAGKVDNTATAIGTPPTGPNVTDTDDETVPAVRTPNIMLTKTATEANYDSVGDVIHYTLVARNTGNVTLSNVQITDPKLGTLTACSPALGSSLAPNATMTCSGSYTANQADVDAGKIDNTATTRGTPPTGPNVTDTDDETVPAVRTPSISLLKSATEPNYDAVGDVIHYTLLGRNTGNVTLSNVQITDPKLGTLTSCSPALGSSLAPNATMTCSGSYIATQLDLNFGRIDNLATVVGTPPTGPGDNVSDTDDATVPAVQNPSINLTKRAMQAEYSAVGDVISYTLIATNTGNVSLSNVRITDPKITVLSCTPPQPTTLAPGARMTCSGSYAVTLIDLNFGRFDNTATATGTPPSGPNVSDTDDETVPADQDVSILLTKTVSETNYNAAGNVIHYTLVSRNTGNVSLSNVRITDTKLITLTGCLPALGSTLAPNATMTCFGTYTATQADVDAGKIDNTAITTGKPPTGPDVSDTDDETIPALRTPSILLVKRATQPNYDAVGDVINYTLVATNTGNVTLSDVRITDPKITVLSCAPQQPATLIPEARLTCTGSYTVTLGDLNFGRIDNTATATGTPPTGPNVSDTDDETVPAVQNSAIVITKVATQSNYDAPGDVISYTLIATNTGNVTLNNVRITDPKITVLNCAPQQPTTLLPTASIVCTGSYTVTQGDLNFGRIDNTATATGTPPSGNDVTDTDDETVPAIQQPALILDKHAEQESYDAPGDVISYTLVATNVGNITLNNVTITDVKLGALTCTPPQPTSLLPGESLTCKGTYTVMQSDLDVGQVDNTATADSDESEPDTDDETVPGIPKPALDIVKTGDLDPVTIGDLVGYTITVQNTGNVTLKNVTITDAKLGILQNVGTLAVGQTAQITDTYGPVNETDLPGPIFNTAGVTGTTPLDEPVGPVTDTHNLPVTFSPALDIVKMGDAGPVTIGDTVRYTISVQNTGNVTLTNVTVTDEKLGIVKNVGTLIVGETAQITGTYGPVTELDLPGPIYNVAGATGTTPTNEPTTPVTDTHTVPVTFTPALDIDKTGTVGTVTIGDTVRYTITVRNTGNVTLKNVTVTDAKLALQQNVGTLAVGQSAQVTGSYGPVTQADLPGPIFNAAGVSGTTPVDEPTPPVTDTHEVPVTFTPALDIDKTGDAGPVTIGDTVRYTITVRNTGNVSLTNVTVTDAKLGILQNVGTLSVGQTAQVTGSYGPVTEADLPGPIFNTAGVTGTGPLDTPLPPITDTHTVPVVDRPALEIDKTGTVGPVTIGDTVRYTITVRNTGNVTLNNVTVTDAKLGIIQNVGTLSVGQSAQVTGSYGPVSEADLPGPIFNTAGVTGTTPIDEPTPPVTDTHEVPVTISPQLTLVKTATPITYRAAGDIINYSYRLTNAGNVTLKSPFTVSDNKTQVTCPAQPSTLAVGESLTCTATYVITQADLVAGSVTNIAQAKAKAPNNSDVISNEDDETVTREDLPGTLGDQVWRDDNKNGLQDANELGAEGVKVDLYKDDGTFVATQNTDSNGGYLFTELEEGSYYVEFTLPQEFSFSPYNAFNNEADTVDSDAEMAWVEVGVTNGGIEQAELGAPLTFTIDYTNTDLSRTATNIVLSTLVPVGTTRMGGSEGWVCEDDSTAEGTICTLTLPSLAANTSGSTFFTVLLDEDEVIVPDQLDFSVKLSHGQTARTPTVTLGQGAINRSLDAGLVRMDSTLATATPPGATSLPETEQPQQRETIFLPALRLSDSDATSSSTQPQEESQGEAQDEKPDAEAANRPGYIFLPTVESSE